MKSLKQAARQHQSIGQALRFILVGGSATVLHYAVYFVLKGLMDVHLAFALGYLVSFLYNFALSSLFTFAVRMTVARFVRFSLSHVVNYCIQASLLSLFLRLGVGETWAPLPVYAISVPVNFLLVRLALLFRVKR